MKIKINNFIKSICYLSILFALTKNAHAMNSDLAIAMFDAVPEFWYGLFAFVAIIVILLFNLVIKNLKLKQKVYFVKRDRMRILETIYTSKDGYFAWIYPDEEVNDPRNHIREKCSRRLAVELELENGLEAKFDEVLSKFDDANREKVEKLVQNLRLNGHFFEEIFYIPSQNKHIRLSGSVVTNDNGKKYCDLIWFRDLSEESNKIDILEKENSSNKNKISKFESFLNSLPHPIWLRDENLKLEFVNDKYAEYLGDRDKGEVLTKNLELDNEHSVDVAKKVLQTKHQETIITNSIVKGERKSIEIEENHFENDKSYSAGIAIDTTELDELRRNLKIHQTAHAEIMSSLGSAFAVFSNNYDLKFYNKAFIDLWKLDESFTNKENNYSSFLDYVREKRLIPEVPNYTNYKKEEQKDFNKIIEAKEDLLHLPDGKTIRRIRSPHPQGGLLFAYEDVTDKLAVRRSYNALTSVYNETIKSLNEAVIVFNPAGRLTSYNDSFIKLWNASELTLQQEPSISDVIEMQKSFFKNVDSWTIFKNDLAKHITNKTTKSLNLHRSDDKLIECTTTYLPDSSILVSYLDKSPIYVEKELNKIEESKFYAQNSLIWHFAHEISPIIKTLASFSKEVEKDVSEDVKQEYLNNIRQISNQIEDKLNEFGDLTPELSQKKSLKLDTVNINEVIEGSLSIFEENLIKKDIKLNQSINIEQDWFVADEIYVKQIIFYAIESVLIYCNNEAELNIEVYFEKTRKNGKANWLVFSIGESDVKKKNKKLTNRKKLLTFINNLAKSHGGFANIESSQDTENVTIIKLPA